LDKYKIKISSLLFEEEEIFSPVNPLLFGVLSGYKVLFGEGNFKKNLQQAKAWIEEMNPIYVEGEKEWRVKELIKVVRFLIVNREKFEYYISEVTENELLRHFVTEFDLSAEVVEKEINNLKEKIGAKSIESSKIDFSLFTSFIKEIVSKIKIKKRVTNLEHLGIAKQFNLYFLTGDKEIIEKCKQFYPKILSYIDLRKSLNSKNISFNYEERMGRTSFERIYNENSGEARGNKEKRSEEIQRTYGVCILSLLSCNKTDSSNQISACSPSKLPSNFNKVSFFSHKFKLEFTKFKSFFSQLFKQKSSSSPSNLSSDNYRISSAKSFSHFFNFSSHNLLLESNVFKISFVIFFLFILLLPLAKASVVLNATDFIGFNISASEIARIVSGGLIVSGGWVNATNANFSQICLGGNCKTFWPSSNLVGGSGSIGYIPVWTASDTLGNSLINQTGGNVWITSGNLIVVSGNVGIGTTSPNYKLTVSGGDIYGSNNLYIVGNVGIGTTSPLTQLDVVGNVNASAFYDRDNSAYYINPAGSISANLAGDIVLGSGGQIDFYDETGDKVYWYSNTYGTGIESGTLTDWSGTRFRWRIGGTSVSSGTEVMTLTSTGLRIGGGDASYKLDVRANLNSEGSQIEYVASNDNVIASQTSGGTWEVLDNTLEGFMFNSGSYTNLAGVALYIKRSTKASLTGWVRVRLYTDNAGVPGTWIATGTTIYANRISTTGSWYYFGLRYGLSANTNYWIIVERSGLEADDIYLDSVTTISNHVYSNDGTTWTSEAKSLRYYVYAYSSRGIYAYTFGSYNADNGQAIYGYSYTSPGVYGYSQSHYGVRGYSLNSWGGYFQGASGVIGYAYSGSGTAVQGYTDSARTGYIFYGGQAYNLFTGEGLRLDMSSAGLTKVFYYDGSTFYDRTTTWCQSGGTAYALLTSTNDVVYFGLTYKFNQLQFDIGTAGAGLDLVWEYSAGSGVWNTLTLSYDETKNFTRDGIVTWSDPGTSWVTDTVNGVSAYWIRVRTNTAPTTAPTAYIACRSGFTGYFARFYQTGQEKFRVDSQGRLYVANEIYPGSTTEEDGIQGSRYIYDAGTGIGINTNFLPSSDNNFDLGNSTYRWRNAYFSGTIYGSISSSGNLLPSADNSYDLGSSSLRWRDLWLSRNAF